jgi:2-polyprenyl-6-methoxyphenol hydroxylase-like FAD-dependent oxidoreductase
VVVGAGPAGAALSLLLAREGCSLTLVEAAGDLDRPFRGEALMPSGLEALVRMGVDPVAADLPRRPLQGWSFWLEGRLLFEVAEPLGSGRPCTLIRQSSLLARLLGLAGQHPGFHLLQGVGVTAPLVRGDRVSGVHLADGRRVEADLVVGCDGRGSLLGRQAERGPESLSSEIDVLWFRIGGAAAAAMADWLRDRFVTVVGTAGTFSVFTSCGGDVQLGWAIEASAATPTPAEGWPRLWRTQGPAELWERVPQLADGGEVTGPSRLRGRVGCAHCWHRAGLLLLGDAAHPMSPVRAQGINMALRDALAAAQWLAPALRHGTVEAIDAALPRVAAERLPEIRLIQALQRRELERGLLLRRSAWLRHLLAGTARWSGPLLARRWVGEQHLLRDGLASGGSA